MTVAFSLPAGCSGGVRRAALALHATGETDREWLLEHLPVSQGRQLRELLAELDAVGIPRDLAAVPARVLEGWGDDDVANLLAQEPPLVAAIVRGIRSGLPASEKLPPDLESAVARVLADLSPPERPGPFWKRWPLRLRAGGRP